MAGESAGAAARRMREKSERLAQSAEAYERGAAGERATAAVLAQLPSAEWTVFHDLRWPGRRFANVDHVVVGPPGVFVIDSKNWSGNVVVRGDVLRQNGYRREKEVAGAAEAALAVAQLTSLVSPWQVHPVLCFVREEPLSGHARDVMVCSTSTIVTMLQSRPRILDAETIRRLSLELDASFRPAAASPPPLPRYAPRQRVPRARPVSGPSSRPSSSTRRSNPEIAGLVRFLVVVVALIMFMGSGGPALVGDLIAGVVTSQTTTEDPPARKSPADKSRKKDGRGDRLSWSPDPSRGAGG